MTPEPLLVSSESFEGANVRVGEGSEMAAGNTDTDYSPVSSEINVEGKLTLKPYLQYQYRT